MKNILISGVPRSGKSYFSKLVCQKLNYFYFPIDSIIGAFQKIYPEKGINLQDKTEVVSQNLTPFISEFIKNLEIENINYVIEGYHIFPTDVAKTLDTSNLEVVYFGYPDIDPEEKHAIVREHQQLKDWTNNLNDEELDKRVKRYIEESKMLKQDCEKYNFRFFDTGKNYLETINSALNKVFGIVAK